MFCDADFEGGICCNPGSNPAVLRIQGITTPEEQNFAVYDPAPQGRKLPALRAEVDEPGRLRPRLFLLLFFTPALRLILASATSLVPAQTGENSLIPLLRLFPPNPLSLGFGESPLVSLRRPQFASKTLVGPAYPTQPAKRSHSGKQRGYIRYRLFLCIAC